MYRYLDAVVVRAAAWPPGRQITSWPDLTSPEAGPASWRTWLEDAWHTPGFAVAVEQASPGLARRVRQICGGAQVPEPALRRVVLSVMRYLLRASGRATPFGLFAGVAPARIIATTDLPVVRLGDTHRPIARVTAAWIAEIVRRLEGETALRRRLMVTTNLLVFVREGRVVLPHRTSLVAGGAPGEASVRATGPVREALRLARDPIPVADLMARLRAAYPQTAESTVDMLVAELVTQRLLLTCLRTPMTVCDPLHYLTRELDALHADEIGDIAEVVKSLHVVADTLDCHNRAPADMAHEHRVRAATAMADIHATTRTPLAVDLLLDGEVTVPACVAAEAAAAAGVLVRLARRPSLSTGWTAWHERFLDRYGPRAMVPLRDVVDADIGLGYPAGYDSGLTPADTALHERDRRLLTLAHSAAMRRQREIVLDDAVIADLGAITPDMPIQASTELTVRIDAPTAQAVAEGRFTLVVTGASRAVGTLTGRFLDLFDEQCRQRMRTVYASLPTGTRDALAVQVSAPAPYIGSENVARAPQVLPHLLPVGDHPGTGRTLSLDDLAVTADLHGIYLVSLSYRRAVEPMIFNAVNLIQHTHPLARFLLEAPHALRAPCAGFDWGVAATLPFVPALRHGRTIISPARWRLTATDLPGPSAGWQEWNAALASWREQVALPEIVELGGGDQRLRLDLSRSAHRVLLREQVDRAGTAVLRLAPSADAAGWNGGRAHELVIPLAATGRPTEPPRLPKEVTSRDHSHLPGSHGRLSLSLYGHPDRHDAILTRHLPRLADALGRDARWWFLRYHDPERHLRIRLTVPPEAFAAATVHVTTWCEQVREAGLTARVLWDTYFPETGRFGGPAAMEVAEVFFAADSAAAVTQLAAVASSGGPHLRAVTAASLLDIATGFLGDRATAMRWLIDHTRSDASPPDRAVYDQAVRMAQPDDHSPLTAQPKGEQIISCWARRRETLAAYRNALQKTDTPPAVVLPDLLHLHHVRMAGPSPAGERACLHLARAAALSWTARARRNL